MTRKKNPSSHHCSADCKKKMAEEPTTVTTMSNQKTHRTMPRGGTSMSDIQERHAERLTQYIPSEILQGTVAIADARHNLDVQMARASGEVAAEGVVRPEVLKLAQDVLRDRLVARVSKVLEESRERIAKIAKNLIAEPFDTLLYSAGSLARATGCVDVYGDVQQYLEEAKDKTSEEVLRHLYQVAEKEIFMDAQRGSETYGSPLQNILGLERTRAWNEIRDLSRGRY